MLCCFTAHLPTPPKQVQHASTFFLSFPSCSIFHSLPIRSDVEQRSPVGSAVKGSGKEQGSGTLLLSTVQAWSCCPRHCLSSFFGSLERIYSNGGNTERSMSWRELDLNLTFPPRDMPLNRSSLRAQPPKRSPWINICLTSFLPLSMQIFLTRKKFYKHKACSKGWPIMHPKSSPLVDPRLGPLVLPTITSTTPPLRATQLLESVHLDHP